MLKKILYFVVVAAFFMPAASQAIPGFMIERMGNMSGQVVYEGQPLANAMLAFFDTTKGLPPIAGGEGRIPDLRGYSDPDGKFSNKLLQGSYYLGVLLRAPDAKLGPPRKGEVFYFASTADGKLRQLAIEDFKQVDYGVINCLLPGNFQETEDHFTVTGTVVKGVGDDEPFPRAIIMAKTVATARRPEYVSAETGEDGKFSLSLPPGKTYYLMARAAITGAKPEPGEDIGKYGANSFAAQGDKDSEPGPPPGTSGEKPVRVIADEALPVTGENGQVVSGLLIHMYKMPDQQTVQNEIRNAADAPNYELGSALNNILFATNSSSLKDSSFAELDLWVKFLVGRADIMIELNGYTDEAGSAQYNLNLSERRAKAVAEYLTGKGVDQARITAVGYGEAKPVANNGTKDGRSQNRRVEIKFKQ